MLKDEDKKEEEGADGLLLIHISKILLFSDRQKWGGFVT